MREIRTYSSEGGGIEANRRFLPLSPNPMAFPRVPRGDTISVMSRRLGRATQFVNDLLRRQF
jgi:hypothetical protein